MNLTDIMRGILKQSVNGVTIDWRSGNGLDCFVVPEGNAYAVNIKIDAELTEEELVLSTTNSYGDTLKYDFQLADPEMVEKVGDAIPNITKEYLEKIGYGSAF